MGNPLSEEEDGVRSTFSNAPSASPAGQSAGTGCSSSSNGRVTVAMVTVGTTAAGITNPAVATPTSWHGNDSKRKRGGRVSAVPYADAPHFTDMSK